MKLASARYLDNLPTAGGVHGHAFRDLAMEAEVLEMTRSFGIGAQFGGKYYCHDVRVIRLPRHGASCPVGIGVSCSADRQVLGKITRDGIYVEQLETDPAHYMPEVKAEKLPDQVVKVDLNKPMAEIRKILSGVERLRRGLIRHQNWPLYARGRAPLSPAAASGSPAKTSSPRTIQTAPRTPGTSPDDDPASPWPGTAASSSLQTRARKMQTANP